MLDKLIPVVSVIMGSQSDWPVMKEATAILGSLEIPNESRIVSAHRTPDRLYEFARAAAGRGVRIIIAGAGGAAHLPGMTAALTHLPVIGVPVKSKAMSGIDSLYSIVQMPKGIPVATVGIDRADNAALIAASILALNDEEVKACLIAFRKKQTDDVGLTPADEPQRS